VQEREQARRAVAALLNQVTTEQDLQVVRRAEALARARRLARLLRDDDEDLESRSLLGWLHWYRYQALPVGQDQQDLTTAVELFTPCFLAGAGGLPEPLLPVVASRAASTAVVLLERALGTADQTLLSATIQLLERILSVTPASDPDRAAMLSNLGAALRTRFERGGVLADLDRAIELGEQAVAATPVGHPNRARYLSNLGVALQRRFERGGVLADLDAAIEAGREAVAATPAGHPDRAGCLSNLGVVLQRRFERGGVLADLDGAIELGEQAVAATPVGHPDHAIYVSVLGIALLTRFERGGVLADLDGAIELGQQAVAATPVGHPDRARYLSNLGNALLTRFERGGVLADLDEAIELGEQAVAATSAGHPGRAGHLSSLGNALQRRFERTGVLADLDAAIEAGREAVAATPVGHSDRAAMLSNLGIALLTRFERTGVLADLDAAIEAGREAVAATPGGHPGRAGHLSNLENALQTRFERTGVLADLDAAIQAGREAVAATPAGHPGRAGHLSNLGNALQTRFERSGGQADWETAVTAFAEAAGAGSAAPSTRIGAARAAAALTAERQPGQAALLLEEAVLLLPEVAPRHLERSDQQYAIGRLAGLAADSAALALADTTTPAPERAERAVRLLEATRAVLLSQALHTRNDLTELRQHHPALAARFAELRDMLDQPATTAPLLAAGASDGAPTDPLAPARDRRQLAGELATVLARIREQDGFATFGLPPHTRQLLEQATAGPVVLVNINSHRSDALLLTGGAVTSLPLPALTPAAVAGQIIAFRQALDTTTDPGASPSDRTSAQGRIREILAWLWDTAAGPVLTALEYDSPPVPGRPWPRVWWAPGGLLSLLPVHAAGHHTHPADPAHRTVMDRVVSSYTPTVGALRYARQRASISAALQERQRSLIVAMPTTPGLPGGGRLPNVPAETALLRTRLPHPRLLTEPEPGAGAGAATGPVLAASDVPTRANVLAHLPGCGIAHFACHASTDPADPSRSLLLLHDHLDDPLNVASLAPVDLGHAQLAYLSACSTALTTATQLLDEAIHLTSAFQLAGFPHVIGSLWPISDAIAVTIADNFYTTLTTTTRTTGEPVLHTRHAAHALHHAVRAARDTYPATPSLWAAYIHAGA
jgi:CHAT domain